MPVETAISIRRTRPADYAAMKAILRDTFEATWRPHVTPASAANYISTDIDGRLVDQHGSAMLVASVAAEIAGLVYWRKDFIESLHVSTRHQGSGVGRRLLDHVERQIRTAGHAQVRLQTDTFNDRSRAFYSAQGYVELDRYPDDEWNSGLTTILFQKTLR